MRTTSENLSGASNRIFGALRIGGAVGVLALLVGHSAAASPTQFPTGVTIYDKALAWNTDFLFTPLSDNVHVTYLMDMQGKILHTWPYAGFPAKFVNPALIGGKKGVVGVQISTIPAHSKLAQTDVVPGEPSVFLDREFGYVDWADKVLWKWGSQAPKGAALQHHDWVRLQNGDTLLLTNDKRTVSGFGDRQVLDDVIYEVNPTGRIVWRWSALAHIKDFGFTRKQLQLVRHAKEPDVLHINDMRVLGANKWAKAGDQRFAPDNIIISSRNANFTAIIDKHTGAVVWRLGPNYTPRAAQGLGPDKLPRPVDQISGQHGAYMIPAGLPGAGDILMLDNQGEAGYPPVPLSFIAGSRVLEINPLSKKIVWEYNARDSGRMAFSFYTPFIGNAVRLPNGNTLIDEGIDGRFFQVTPNGKIVWEYISPYRERGPGAPIKDRPEVTTNWVYRVQAVPASWIPGRVSGVR